MECSNLERFVNLINTIEIYKYHNCSTNTYDDSINFFTIANTKKPSENNITILKKFIEKNELSKIYFEEFNNQYFFEAIFNKNKTIKISIPKQLINNSNEIIEEISIKYFNDNLEQYKKLKDNIKNIYIRKSECTNKFLYHINEDNTYDLYIYNSIYKEDKFKNINSVSLSMLIFELFYQDNREHIDSYNSSNDSKNIMFSNNKVLSINDPIIINDLKYVLDDIANDLIDKKTKDIPNMTINYNNEEYTINDSYIIRQINELINNQKTYKRR